MGANTKRPRSRLSVTSLVVCLTLITAGAVSTAVASSFETFTAPAYPSAACTPTPMGIGPQQWNASVGLPLTPSGAPLPQRLVIGESNETANAVAVNNLLRQCGITEVTLLTETWPGASTSPGEESTLDATVIGAALPPNTTITMAVSPANQGFYGMLVVAADACGFNFVGDPTTSTSFTIAKSASYPAGGCIISLSYGQTEILSSDAINADFMMNQLEAQGVIVVISAGDEGAGGCISSTGYSFSSNAVFKNVTEVGITSNVATLTSAAHGFAAGQQVFLSNLTEPFHGMFTISSVTTNTFSVGLPHSDIAATTLTTPGYASVNFGGLTPSFPATHPGAVAVGGTQWMSQTQSMTTGLGVAYVPGSTYSNYVWKDNYANANCANLSTFPVTGGEGTGGGQSTLYAMPSFQTTATTSSYPGATSFRMIPDVAGLAGWPMYAISNYGMSASAKQLINSAATIVTSQNNGFAIGETVTVAGVGAPFDGTFTVTGTPYTNAFSYTTAAITIANTALTSNVATITTSTPHGLTVGQLVDVVGATNTAFNGTFAVASVPTTTTFTYAKTNVDVISTSSVGQVDVNADWKVTGTVTQSCVASGTPAICSAATFPWVPMLGTSAAAPLIAVGLANVNAVLTARGMAPIDNAGGAMDVHRIFYDPANSSAMTDVVSGNNDIKSLGGWDALPGFDMATGMGVPNFTTLVNLIISRNNSTSPSSPTAEPTTTPTSTPTPSPSLAAKPTAPLVALDLRRPATIAPGVQISAGAGIKGVKVMASKPAASSFAAAPTNEVSLNRWTQIRVPGVPPKSVLTAQIRVGGDWYRLGTATANRSGVVTLPMIRHSKTGTYQLRLTTRTSERSYINLNVVRRR